MLWPDNLITTYRDSDKLTQHQLASWLSIGYKTEFTQLFLNVIKACEGWSHIESLDGLRTSTIRYEFALALANNELLMLHGSRIDCCNIGIFHEVMSGLVDPFTYDDSLSNALKVIIEPPVDLDPKPGVIRNLKKLERMRAIEELHSRGFINSEIARKLNISRERVGQLLKELKEGK